MATRKPRRSSASRKCCRKDGSGQGEGKNYRPRRTIDGVPLKGWVHRVKRLVTWRSHYPLSEGEFHGMLVADWNPQITDFREQHP